MAVALRSLRVTAGMDSREYITGMNQKIAADKAGAASSAAVGAALARTDASANQSGGVLTRLSRQYVDGYGSAARFEAAVSSLGRGIEKGAVPLARVEAILEGIYRKYNLTANAADLMANGQLQLAAAVTTVNGKLAAEEAALNAAALAHKRHGAAANDNGFQQRNLMFQLNDVFQSLALGMPITQVALQQGPQIAQIYGPGEGGIGRAFSESGKLITGMLTKFPAVTAAVALVGVGFAGLTYEINQTTEVSVGFGDTVVAVFEVIADRIYDTLQPAIAAISPWFQEAWDGAVSGFKWLGNTLVVGIVATTELIRLAIVGIPAFFRAAGEGAANAFLAGIEWMVQKALANIKKVRDYLQNIAETIGADKALQYLGFSGKLPDVDPNQTIPRADFGGGKALTDMYGEAITSAGRVARASKTDYMGGFFSDVRGEAIKNAQDDDKKKGGKTARERESDYERAIRRTQEQTKATAEETRVIDLSTYARERQGAVQDILTAAQRDGLAIGKQFANAQELINASSTSLSPALAKERERILGVAGAYAQAKSDAEKAETAQRKYEEAMSFFGGVTRDAIDTFEGALQNGASWWEAFGEAALSVLDKIKSKLLDEVVDALFAVNDAGSGSGGGILSMLFSGIGSLFGGGGSDPWAGKRVASAKGNVFTSPSLSAYSNQIVDRPTYFAFAKGAGVMGEAGPEGIFPLRRDASGRLGVTGTAANQNSTIQMTYAPVYNVQGYGQDIEGLKTQMHRDRQEFKARVVDTVRKAKNSRDL